MVKITATSVMILQLFFSIALIEQSANSLELTPKMMITIKKLQDLVSKSEEPKGTPFPPLISKPEPCQRIAIVGAGIAGLHMAYELKKKGFNNIVVLEKECRAGGKVMSIQHGGLPHELGACYTSPDYIANVYALAKELGVDDFVPLPNNSTVWLDYIPFPLTYKGYVLLEVKRLTKAKTNLEAVWNFIDTTYRYSVLHRQMFGKYQGELIYKPSKEDLAQLNQTFMSFLAKHNLLALVPVLATAHTMQGYGHIDRISTLYGMLWDTPTLFYGMVARSIGVSGGGVDILRKGFQQLTDKLADFTEVRLNIKIKNIKRDSNGVTIKYRNDGQDITEKFDFLIWAPDTREALQVLQNPTPLEKEFSLLKNTWFTTTLFDSKDQSRSCSPIDYWISNLYFKREHSVWSRRISSFALNFEKCLTTRKEKTRVSTVAYQMGDVSPLGTSFLDKKFKQHFVDRNRGH